MTEEVKAKSRLSNNALWIILGVLILLIIGLIIGIVVVKVNHKDTQPTIGDPAMLSDEVIQQVTEDNEKVYEINKIITPMSTEDSIAYLDEQLPTYAGTSMEYQIKILKVGVYINSDMPEEALNLINEIDENALNPREKMKYYDVMSVIYDKLGNEEERQNYNNKWVEQHEIIFGKESELFDGETES